MLENFRANVHNRAKKKICHIHFNKVEWSDPLYYGNEETRANHFLRWEFCWSSWNFALSFSCWSRRTFELLNGHQLSKKLLFKFGFVDIGFLCFSSHFPSSNVADRQTSSENYSCQDCQLSTVIGCIKSRGVKYTPSFDRRVRFRVHAVGNF